MRMPYDGLVWFGYPAGDVLFVVCFAVLVIAMFSIAIFGEWEV